jgi:hypothetical protein
VAGAVGALALLLGRSERGTRGAAVVCDRAGKTFAAGTRVPGLAVARRLAAEARHALHARAAGDNENDNADDDRDPSKKHHPQPFRLCAARAHRATPVGCATGTGLGASRSGAFTVSS